MRPNSRKLSFGIVLLLGCWLLGQLPLHAQEDPTREVSFLFNSTHANLTNATGFWIEGGGLQFEIRRASGLGVVFDFDGGRSVAVPAPASNFTLATAMAGPRYTLPPRTLPLRQGRSSFYGQALMGAAFASSGLFPPLLAHRSGAQSFALMLGGGVNYACTSHLSLRVLEANWLFTAFPNAHTDAQNSLRLATGISVRF